MTIVAIVGALNIFTASPARAESVTSLSVKLPSARQGASAVWDGRHAYIFGGFHSSSGASDEIVRYDPTTHTVTVMDARLPSPRYYASAVWDGTHAYIFGGSSGSTAANISQIVRYDPSTDSVSVVASLPTGLDGTSAVWDGRYAYIFGGRVFGGLTTSQILRFDPGTATIAVLPAALPEPVQGTSAVFDGTRAYVFGGLTWAGFWTDRVTSFNPESGAVATMSARLPTGRGYTSAVWSGAEAIVFGGHNAGTSSDQVVSYDPGSDSVTVPGAFFPYPDYLTGAVWDGTHGYIFGGVNQGTAIRRFDPLGPSVPKGFTVGSGPAYGEIKLSWKPPANDGGAPITAYRIYRGETSDSISFYEEIDAGLSYVDTGLSWSTTRYYRVSAVNANGQEGQASKPLQATTFPEPPSSVGLNRWWGVEGGAGCLGPDNCSVFSQIGLVYGVQSGEEYEDPDGVTRPWPARSGRAAARPTTPDTEGRPLPAYIETADPFPGGTVSFALRIHTLPREPVTFYRHADSLPDRGIRLTLSPTGHVVATTGGGAASTSATLELERWHIVGMSYGAGGEDFVLYVDGNREMSMELPLGGPGGRVSLGIVNPLATPFALGIDDYVEATMEDAPILGARISYLNPAGPGGQDEWQKQDVGEAKFQECMDAAENWQVAAEDIRLETPSGKLCDPSGFGLESSKVGEADTYGSEGIPSSHDPTPDYRRVPVEPGTGDTILAVRPRISAIGPLAIAAGFSQGQVTVSDEIAWETPTSHNQWWLPANAVGHPWQADATPWTVQALGSVKLRLENMGLAGQRQHVDSVRLDYVWVPAD